MLLESGSEDEYLTNKLLAQTDPCNPLDDFTCVGDLITLEAKNAGHAEGDILPKCRVTGYRVQATEPKKSWYVLNPEEQAFFHHEGACILEGDEYNQPYQLVIRDNVEQPNQGVHDDSIVQ
jgi:hypothetical protein